MPPFKPITIVGGGLAGLTLGIGLRQRQIPVTVFETGTYPRQRVCGEFISGNGQSVLDRLGLRTRFETAHPFHAKTVMFISGGIHSPIRQLTVPAICLSRYHMDALLAKEFVRLGGELRDNNRWTGPEQDGVVRATGRHARPTESGWRWFGLKAHARDVPLQADLEMHVSSECYVGMNRIDGGQVNVCGLFRSRPGESPNVGFELLRGKQGSLLHERLANARFDDNSFCSVAGLSLKPQRARDKSHCCIGDSITMIPPVTGNGMSMAFESAEIAVEPIAAYSRGLLSWTEARSAVAGACDSAFARRLAWARLLQWLMFSSLLHGRTGSVLLKSDWLWRTFFSNTR